MWLEVLQEPFLQAGGSVNMETKGRLMANGGGGQKLRKKIMRFSTGKCFGVCGAAPCRQDGAETAPR